MTRLALTAVILLFAVTVYFAVRAGQATRRAGDFIDAGGSLPGWTLMFAGAGVLAGALQLQDHFVLSALYGLQYSHVALGLVLAALCGAMAHKRLWIAARALGVYSPVAIFSDYYGSVAIRVILVALALLFALPFAAHGLGLAAGIAAAAADGALGRGQAVFILGVFLFLVSALGGWRGVVYAAAAQSFLLLALIVFIALFLAAGLPKLAILATGPSALKGVLASQIPGVLQYSAGIGKDAAAGGIWTTLTIVSAAASLIGVTLSPAIGLLTTTARPRAALAFQQVWMTAGLATGALLLASPLIGAEIAAADPDGMAAGAPNLHALLTRISALDELAAFCFLAMLLAAMQIAVSMFVSAAAGVIASDVVHRFVLPDLDGKGLRFAARAALAALYGAVILLAAAAPGASAVIGSTALSLGAQLLPAAIGLCWAPWISRSGVLTGLIFGVLLVVFTEPPGLIAFEALFLDLPWGRWPLTIHSTAWGLAFNSAACLLVSLLTRAGPERERRDAMHSAFRALASPQGGRSAFATAKWSLTLIWTFFALGPGAILGNSFFSKPMFTEGDALIGAPSLWVWQIVFWFLGVLLVWWLAYQGRMSVIDAAAIRRIELDPPASPLTRRGRPPWLALFIARVAGD